MFVIFRLLQLNPISLELISTIVLVAIISPRSHALIFCAHGYGMLSGKRWSIVIKTFVWSALIITSLYSAIIYPLVWIFLIPPILLAEKKAHDWVWAAVPRPARRRLRRIWSDASRTKHAEEE